MFAIQLGIARGPMEDMSVPEMVDHVDYWLELNRGSQNGN
jgi:hypothetical protein